MTHTPGPWEIGTGAKSYNVCSKLPDTSPSSIVAEHIWELDDARLIAAAPAMLDALKACVVGRHEKHCANLGCSTCTARALIQQNEGETA